MTILAIDYHNMLHRARSGFTAGPYPIVFNFFRALRAQVELHKPTRVYVAMEGHPRARHEMLPVPVEVEPIIGIPPGEGKQKQKPIGYKANRTIEPGTPKAGAHQDFLRQCDLITELMGRHLPVSMVHHQHHEADDTIYNLIRRSSTAVPWIVVSNDSDFTQLLQEFDHVKLYNPMKKVYVSSPSYDYILYKALKGDGSDNIPGIKGVGDKTAERLATTGEDFIAFFNDPDEGYDRLATFDRNIKLITFAKWTDEEALEMTSSEPAQDWAAVRRSFEEWGFRSLLREAAWNKFEATFAPLWGG